MDFTVKVLAAAALGLHWSNITVLLYEITLWLHYGYVRASLVAESVKNLPAMQETRVRSLGWEDPLEEGMATHSSILVWIVPMDGGAWQATVQGGRREWDTTKQLSTAHC